MIISREVDGRTLTFTLTETELWNAQQEQQKQDYEDDFASWLEAKQEDIQEPDDDDRREILARYAELMGNMMWHKRENLMQEAYEYVMG